MKAPWLAGLLLGFLSTPLLAAVDTAGTNVEVVFTSGERAYGQLVSQSDTEVVIIRKVCTRSRVISGQATFPRRTVASLTPVPSLLELYAQMDKATPDTYPEQFTLAKWCFERGLQDQAFQHAKHLYDEDPTDQVSQDLLKELGYIQDGGQWVKEGAFATKHGLVNFDGRWLTPAQVDLRKADIKASYEVITGVEHEHTLENAMTNDQHRIKEDQGRLTAITKAIADIKQQNQANAQPAQRPGMRNQAQQQAQVADTTDDQDLVNQKKEVQKNLDAATKQLATDQAAVEADKPEVEKLQAALTAAHQAFLDTLPKDDPELKTPGKAPAGAKPSAAAPAKNASKAAVDR